MIATAIIGAAIAMAVSGCGKPEQAYEQGKAQAKEIEKTRLFKTLYSESGISVREDMVTGNLIYGSRVTGGFEESDAVPYSQLTKEQIARLKERGYVDLFETGK